MRQWTIRDQVHPTYPDIHEYTILEPNPDAGKAGVSYSGSHFGVVTTESREDANLIAAAPSMYEALREIVDALYDVKLPTDTLRLLYPWLIKVKPIVEKAEGK